VGCEHPSPALPISLRTQNVVSSSFKNRFCNHGRSSSVPFIIAPFLYLQIENLDIFALGNMELPFVSRNSEARHLYTPNTNSLSSHNLPLFDSELHDAKDDKALIPVLYMIDMKRTRNEMV
jgi:hypothetical protein